MGKKSSENKMSLKKILASFAVAGSMLFGSGEKARPETILSQISPLEIVDDFRISSNKLDPNIRYLSEGMSLQTTVRLTYTEGGTESPKVGIYVNNNLTAEASVIKSNLNESTYSAIVFCETVPSMQGFYPVTIKPEDDSLESNVLSLGEFHFNENYSNAISLSFKDPVKIYDNNGNLIPNNQKNLRSGYRVTASIQVEHYNYSPDNTGAIFATLDPNLDLTSHHGYYEIGTPLDIKLISYSDVQIVDFNINIPDGINGEHSFIIRAHDAYCNWNNLDIGNFNFNESIPEPGSLELLVLGGLAGTGVYLVGKRR
jgi:hypothetical protein